METSGRLWQCYRDEYGNLNDIPDYPDSISFKYKKQVKQGMMEAKKLKYQYH